MSATATLTDSDAYAVMERVRWPDGQPVCPHCGKTGAWFIEPRNGVGRKTRTSQESQRRVWRCAVCRDQFSVIVGTPLEGTKVPLPLWIKAVELACRPEGIGAYELAGELGVTQRTSRRIMSVLRGTSRTVRVPKYGDRRSSPRRSRTKHAEVAPEPAYCACGCGEQTVESAAHEDALVRHGGYGETRSTVRRACPACGWTLTASVGATRPPREQP